MLVWMYVNKLTGSFLSSGVSLATVCTPADNVVHCVKKYTICVLDQSDYMYEQSDFYYHI